MIIVEPLLPMVGARVCFTMSHSQTYLSLGCVMCLVNEVWKVIWIAVINEIWKHRNKVIFKGGVVDVLEVFALIQLKTWT